MVKSFKKKKKKPILFILYDFQNFFKLFFSKFQFQNWNLGNMWSSSPITSNSIQSFLALKKSKPNRIQQAQPNTQPTNTQHTHKHCSGCTTGPKKKILLWMHTYTPGSMCGQWKAKFKKTKKKKRKKKRVKVSQIGQSDSHRPQFHIKK